jgi:DNA mismatch repair ATPase MutS
MKAYLMHRDQDFDLEQPLPPNAEDLARDLDLNTLWSAMALGDEFLFDVARKAVLASLRETGAIVYRQQVLADCLAQPATVRQIYDLAVEAILAERKVWGFWAKSPDSILYRSIQVLELLADALKRLRAIADAATGKFQSEGFVRFFAMLEHELDDDYFQAIAEHLRALKFPGGVTISAALGKGNKGTDYILRQTREQRWIDRFAPAIGAAANAGYSFRIADRDESGFQALAALRGQGINLVANALAQATDHIRSFFVMLRTELAFYVGCLNLHAQLAKKGEPVCVPVPVSPAGADGHLQSALAMHGLYDVCLSLHIETRAVGNDVNADGKSLVFITGANQGGKSTFLRSVGLAQLMMQSGIFAPAESFRATVCSGIFTHFKREEDASMTSGKLDEELSRMSTIADQIAPNGLLLCNESFAATNEREGSEIARQVIRALTESDVRVYFVTHLYDLAHGFYEQALQSALYLRAERRSDGQRTYRLIEGEPEPTSHGEDSYRRIFGAAAQPTHDGGAPVR